MSRSFDKKRISGKSKIGNIYNCEALEEDQIFSGAIFGEKNAIEKLQLEDKNFTAYIGRSKFTQYGKCEFNFVSIEEIVAPKFGEKFYLRLESPSVPAADYFIDAEKVLADEVSDKP